VCILSESITVLAFSGDFNITFYILVFYFFTLRVLCLRCQL